MSLQLAAEHLKKYGRGEDTQLVHMTPGELQALQSMAVKHGGSLTINPHTGLPEAGFLSGLLSVALPAVAMYFGGPLLGSALMPGASAALQAGLGAGLISGGLKTLTTGDIGKGLTSGLTSGLLAGAGTSLMGSSAAGTPTSNVNTGTAAQVVESAIPQAATQATNQGLVSMMQNPNIINPGLAAANPTAATIANAAQVAPAVAPVAVAPTTPPPSPPVGTGLYDKFKALSPLQKGAVGLGGLGLLGSLAEQPTLNDSQDKGSIRPYNFTSKLNANVKYPTQEQLYDASGNPVVNSVEQNYFTPNFEALPVQKAATGGIMHTYAEGGVTDMAGGGAMAGQAYPQGLLNSNTNDMPSQSPMNNNVVDGGYEPAINTYTGSRVGPGMAEGGIAGYNLGGYATGGNPRLLTGPGDGMSDNIPAIIGHKQPARLADGEFVIPADVVSHLGNGSTDAGAKRLYAMMDNVRKARTGNEKQGKQIKAEKYLPA